MAVHFLYSITNLANDKIYVGVTKDFHHRIKVHLNYLKNGKHKNKYLQSQFDKYGEHYFFCDIISEFNNKHDCYLAEKFMTDYIFKMDKEICMNMISGGIDIAAKANAAYVKKLKSNPILLEELKKKSSKINKGRKWSQEYKDNMSIATMGRIVSDETKEKIRLAHKGGKANGAKKVLNIKTGKVYNCLKDVAEEIGMKYCTLQAKINCRNRNTNKTDFRWL